QFLPSSGSYNLGQCSSSIQTGTIEFGDELELLLSPHAGDPYQVRGLPICLAGEFWRPDLRGPAAFCFQGLCDFPRIADEVVPRERKLEAKPPFLWVQPAAQHEPSEE